MARDAYGIQSRGGMSTPIDARHDRAEGALARPAGVGQEGLEPSANGLRERGEGGDAGQRVGLGSIEERSEPLVPVETPGPASEGAGPDSVDVVEAALAHAIRKAADAGEWDRVTIIAKEFGARRLLRANVVSLTASG